MFAESGRQGLPEVLRKAGTLRTRRSYQDVGAVIEEVELVPTSRRGRYYRPRASTDPLVAVPENVILQQHQSLEWDGFGENASIANGLQLNETYLYLKRCLLRLQ